MAYDIEEQENIESLKAWWKKYGTLLASVFFIAAVAFGGWRAWQFYEKKQAEDANAHYSALENAVDKKELKQVKNSLGILQNDYAGTIYAGRASLLAAHLFLEQGDVASGKTQLQWIIDHSKDQGLMAVAKLRLSGLLLDEKAYDKAMALLQGDIPEAFKPLVADRKGDILLAQGKKQEARDQYTIASKLMSKDDPWLPIVSMKLEALGGDPS